MSLPLALSGTVSLKDSCLTLIKTTSPSTPVKKTIQTLTQAEKIYHKGIRCVGMDVSGGYKAARGEPSMCLGGDQATLELGLTILEKVTAKDPHGHPCVGRCGWAAVGHYVKMVHNGI